MSEENTVTATETQGADGQSGQADKTFTQEEVNALIGERLERERKKFEGFEDFKAKAAQYDELQEANKTELEKAMERASKAESELESLRTEKARRELLDKVSKETGVPADLLKGETEEELAESAKQIAEFAKANEPGIPKDKGGAAAKRKQANEDDWLRDALTRR